MRKFLLAGAVVLTAVGLFGTTGAASAATTTTPSPIAPAASLSAAPSVALDSAPTQPSAVLPPGLTVITPQNATAAQKAQVAGGNALASTTSAVNGGVTGSFDQVVVYSDHQIDINNPNNAQDIGRYDVTSRCLGTGNNWGTTGLQPFSASAILLWAPNGHTRCNYLAVTNRYGKSYGACVSSNVWGYNFGSDYNDDLWWVAVQDSNNCPAFTTPQIVTYDLVQNIQNPNNVWDIGRFTARDDCERGGNIFSLSALNTRRIRAALLWSAAPFTFCNYLSVTNSQYKTWGTCINENHWGFNFGGDFTNSTIQVRASNQGSCPVWSNR